MKGNMETLWAPWRTGYIIEGNKAKSGCVFCDILKEEKDKKNYILLRRQYSYVVLNIYPYNNGHLLIVPNRHVKSLNKLRAEEKEEIFNLMDYCVSLLDGAMSPQGYNIGINLGRVAGAGFPGHLHVHVVPRWKGDANFMPVTGKTKVISQSLKELYKLLLDADKEKHRKIRK